MNADPEQSVRQAVGAEAARLIYEEHLEVVRAAIHRKLNEKIRRRLGTSDVLQNTLKSFAESPAVTADPDQILPRFMEFLNRKICNAARQHRKAEKRDVRRERSLDSSDAHMIADHKVPSAEYAAIAEEELARLSDEEFTVVTMRLAGHAFREIGEAIGKTDQTASNRLQEVLKRLKAEDDRNSQSSP